MYTKKGNRMSIGVRLNIVVLLIILSLAMCVHLFCFENFGSNIRFFNDTHDKYVYSIRGSWFPLQKAPYSEVFSEYPQLATYFFAVPYLFTQYSSAKISRDYFLIFSLLMMLFLYGIYLLLQRMLDKNYKYYSLIILLPSILYFSFNRYDVLPAFLSILSLYLLYIKKYNLSSFLLALGVLSKWYLIILFPIYFLYCCNIEKRLNYNMLIIFVVTGIVGILPTFFISGLDGFLVPYKFHMSRGYNKESLFYIIKAFFNGIFSINIGFKPVYFAFFLLQFSAVLLLLLFKVDSFEKVVKLSAVFILVFMLFAKFYSPQWILWVFPFLILLINSQRDIIILLLFDLSTYIYFPVFWDLSSIFPIKVLFFSLIVIKSIFLIYYIMKIIKELNVESIAALES